MTIPAALRNHSDPRVAKMYRRLWAEVARRREASAATEQRSSRRSPAMLTAPGGQPGSKGHLVKPATKDARREAGKVPKAPTPTTRAEPGSRFAHLAGITLGPLPPEPQAATEPVAPARTGPTTRAELARAIAQHPGYATAAEAAAAVLRAGRIMEKGR